MSFVSWLAALAIAICHLGCQASPPASPLPQAGVASVQSSAPRESTAGAATTERYDLARDERRGGHTLARHVGQSDDDLDQRLRREPRISAASTYTDRDAAERVVALTLAQHRTRINQWLARKGPRPNLALDYRGVRGTSIGRSLTRRGRAVVCTDAVVVLRWDDRSGFFVLTSYPEVSR